MTAAHDTLVNGHFAVDLFFHQLLDATSFTALGRSTALRAARLAAAAIGTACFAATVLFAARFRFEAALLGARFQIVADRVKFVADRVKKVTARVDGRNLFILDDPDGLFDLFHLANDHARIVLAVWADRLAALGGVARRLATSGFFTALGRDASV